MHIIIFASTADFAQKMQAELDDTTNRVTVAATWTKLSPIWFSWSELLCPNSIWPLYTS
jgi:hypothetical protein